MMMTMMTTTTTMMMMMVMNGVLSCIMLCKCEVNSKESIMNLSV